MHNCATKSNLLILHPQNNDRPTVRTPGWYVLYPPNSAEPSPVFIQDPADYSDHTYTPPSLPCADVTNQRVTGKCKLVYAFIEEDPTSYQRQTIDVGTGENVLVANGRVTNPYAEPYLYTEQQTYGFVKYHDFFDPKSVLDQSDYTHLVLLTARQIPSPRMPLKVFGTPITLTYRVVQLSERVKLASLAVGVLSRLVYDPTLAEHEWSYTGVQGSQVVFTLPDGFFGEFILPIELLISIKGNQATMTSIGDASLGVTFQIHYDSGSYTRLSAV